MPRSKEQFEALRIQKIKHIEQVALECFAEKGFHRTSMSYIAKKAGISTGLSYNYYSSKEELLQSIYIKGVQSVYKHIQEKLETKEQFTAFIEHIFLEIESNLDFWKLYFIVLSQPDVLKLNEAKMADLISPILNAIVPYFSARGYDSPELEAQLLFSTLDGICIHYIMDPQHYPIHEIKQKIISKYV